MDWQPVMSPWGGYTDGFESKAHYEFKRHGEPDETAAVFRLTDTSPYFNLAGLYFRPTLVAHQVSHKPPQS